MTPSETSVIFFFQPGDLDLWPMTLIFKLFRDIIKVHASTKFWVCTSDGSGVRAFTVTQAHKHTETQTHRQLGPIPYPRPLTQEGMKVYREHLRPIYALHSQKSYPQCYPQCDVTYGEINLCVTHILMSGDVGGTDLYFNAKIFKGYSW